MIIDHLSNANRYSSLSEKIKAALQFLQSTGLRSFAKGRHEIDGESIFAIVNEYETTDVSNE